jgi:hypothetical protein
MELGLSPEAVPLERKMVIDEGWDRADIAELH